MSGDSLISKAVDIVTGSGYTDGVSEYKRELAKSAFIDTLGVLIRGLNEPVSARLREVLTGPTEPNDVSLADPRCSLSPFSMGVAAHALDYDDVNFDFQGHPSACLVPAVICLGQELGLGGAEYIDAYLVGLEVDLLLGIALGSAQYSRGWHTTASIGTFGVTAAASRMLRLSPDATRRAFGIVASVPIGIRKNFGTMTKPLHAGFAVGNGLFAARMAQADITSTRDPFSSSLGLAELLGNQHSLPDSVGIDQKLQSAWSNVATITKKYPCCTYTHKAIDAVISLVEEYSIEPKNIKRITSSVHPIVPSVLIYERPEDTEQAKFCMEFCLATAATFREVNLDSFSSERITNVDVRDLSERIEMKVHSDLRTDVMHDEFSEVEIELFSGKSVAKRVYYPSGHPENPLKPNEVFDKFVSCCRGTISLELIDRLYTRIEQLETANSGELGPIVEAIREAVPS